MKNRNWLKEMVGLVLYKTSDGKYFYAWSAKNAIKKNPNKKLYVVNDYGNEIYVKGT